MQKNTRAILRILLGLLVLIFGLNKFFGFVPLELPPGEASAFLIALEQSGYFIQFLACIEILVGLLLILGLWTNLALLILLPISVNALLFHVFLFPEKVGAAAAVATLNIYFIIMNYKAYLSLLKKSE